MWEKFFRSNKDLLKINCEYGNRITVIKRLLKRGYHYQFIEYDESGNIKELNNTFSLIDMAIKIKNWIEGYPKITINLFERKN